ncbi:MAG: phosphoribosylamine--glycine ligase [Cyclobacteriaceae bacterium]|jgi:phosphoribosylamine--glycine ligase|nr:phosphoribosylamine--glycine ligase [Cyclobacteriaceae bacterium]
MNVLLIGSGGREHALAWKIKQSKQCDHLWVAPGNPGTATLAHNLPIAPADFAAVGQACRANKIDLVVVGPEGPLVQGIRDYFESDPTLQHIGLVGPGKVGAALEGSKDFSKQFMQRHGVPTAKAFTVTLTNLAEGLHYLATCALPIVLKADGLAAGKGVVICTTHAAAQAELRAMLEQKKFGEASAKVLIEEFLRGIELSVFVLTDGDGYVVLPEAKDYKRIGDGDTGPNTGGMGSVSPVPFATPAFLQKVEERVIKPTLAGLQKEGIPYRGFIFIGLMNVEGEPYVIEYNVRMGDPETQSVVSRIESDLLDLLSACARGQLKNKTIAISPAHALTVVMASGGYPGDFTKGHVIDVGRGPAHVFHAGTRKAGDQLVTDGGRVFGITAVAGSLAEARAQAYTTAGAIAWPGKYLRADIGMDLLHLVDDVRS